MATVHVALATINKRGVLDRPFPIINSVPRAVETLASAAGSAPGTIQGNLGEVWSITATGNVWVMFGEAPVAAAGAGHLVLAGQTRDFSVNASGEKIAVKDA